MNKKLTAAELIDLNFSNTNNAMVKVLHEEHNVSITYAINLDDDVTEPSQYRLISETLASMTENDIAIWNINTAGGSLYTTIMLLDDIANCKGANYGRVIQGSSAGSVIALALDDVEVVPYGDMFIHGIQSYNYGDPSKQIKKLEFLQNKQKEIMKDIYSDFLTEDEIEQVMNGAELELDWKDCNARLDLRREKAKKLEEELTEEIEKVLEEHNIDKDTVEFKVDDGKIIITNK